MKGKYLTGKGLLRNFSFSFHIILFRSVDYGMYRRMNIPATDKKEVRQTLDQTDAEFWNTLLGRTKTPVKKSD
jgi:hypothetical protein